MTHVLDLREKQNKGIPQKQTKRKGLRKIISFLLEWFLYLVAFVLIVWGTPAILKIILGTEYPIASITSSSMWPALKQGDVVLISGIDSANDINVGDIVVFENEKGFTIHRVIKIGDGEITTKGDANNVEDQPVSFDKVVGKAVFLRNKPFKIPVLGKLSQLFK